MFIKFGTDHFADGNARQPNLVSDQKTVRPSETGVQSIVAAVVGMFDFLSRESLVADNRQNGQSDISPDFKGLCLFLCFLYI